MRDFRIFYMIFAFLLPYYLNFTAPKVPSNRLDFNIKVPKILAKRPKLGGEGRNIRFARCLLVYYLYICALLYVTRVVVLGK